MNEAVEETLETLLQVVGVVLLDQPRRLEGFLRDMHPDSPQEVSVLLEAVQCGVVAQLRGRAARVRGAEREGLVASLTAGSGLDPSLAAWAVAVWCRILLGESTEQGVRRVRQRTSCITDRPGSLDDVLGRVEGSGT